MITLRTIIVWSMLTLASLGLHANRVADTSQAVVEAPRAEREGANTAVPAQQFIDLDLLLQPVQMTREGLNWFFTSVYNSPRYITEILPESLANLGEFLSHGKQMNFGRDYTRATFSLFSQKVKGCEYISAYEFITFAHALPHLVEHHFVSATTRDQRKQDLKKMLYQEFLNKFDAFKSNPSAFFDTLSDQLLEIADPDAGQHVSVDALRHTIIRFMEVCLSKVYWDANDVHLWSNVSDISNSLNALKEAQIIVDNDDANDLYWSLAHRFCYFVSLIGTQLPNEVFHEVQLELRQPTCCLLLHEEQVSLIESKRRMIDRVVTEQFAKKQAMGHGIITESIS